MAKLNINEAKASDMSNVFEDYVVPALSVDAPQDQKETEWLNSKWTTYWGYFNVVPDLKSAILMKAIWNVGKGYTTDNASQVILDKIRGWGKDTFQDILFNMEIIQRIGGDSFAEIIRSDEGTLINLKPLDPGTIKIIINRKGEIIRYEEINRVDEKDLVVNKFTPDEIFHLSHNRLANQIHGISDIESLEPVITAEEENFANMRTIMKRQAKPLIMFKLGTDNKTKIAAFVSKMDQALNKGENIYVPDDENTVKWEVIQVNVSSVIMSWRDDIRNKFYRTIGLPQIVPGASGGSTESESKVIYKAFEQIVEKDQRALEKQIWQQLAIKLDLIHPASISPEMATDEGKDAGQQTSFQPNEVNTELKA